MKKINCIHAHIIDEAYYFWATPTGGFGHIADEQPLPFIFDSECQYTSRYGGEESNEQSGIKSLPLPWGRLKQSLSLQQWLNNFLKRKVNIYWRNLFSSFSNNNEHFFFLTQLNYKTLNDGFVGRSPMVDFKRSFTVNAGVLQVQDDIFFKSNMCFEFFNYAILPRPLNSNIEQLCDVSPNKEMIISSASGSTMLDFKQLANVSFSKGDKLSVNYSYRVCQHV
ncbi:hypothetical protein Q4519_17345 [Motilimonas sp. 1_MG-2023]|uniref:hypothetical protein n=1 Tax=Motilimonas sp. 1_MG-2023 TaxID=3062672 RepID=UPI0026E1A9C3|nr:hypothetical protein [Motilimonas sp. 1_MG-2023]MDO6527448.1 hypothetical protein [Motilimonas sp. 1_MG-2023]